METALIVVDVQNDFFLPDAPCPPEGDQSRFIENVNKLLNYDFGWKILTQDWHPLDHVSFQDPHNENEPDSVELEHNGKTYTQKKWPKHCVANTFGADFPIELEKEKADFIVQKGTTKDIDALSPFLNTFNEEEESTSKFREQLSQKNIKHIFVCGEVTEVCVKLSALHARQSNRETYVIQDAVLPADTKVGAEAIEELKAKNVHIITVSQVPYILRKLMKKPSIASQIVSFFRKAIGN